MRKQWCCAGETSILKSRGFPERPLVKHFVCNVFRSASWNDAFYNLFPLRCPIEGPLGTLGCLSLFLHFWHTFSEVDFVVLLGSVLGGAGGRGRLVKYAEYAVSGLMSAHALLPQRGAANIYVRARLLLPAPGCLEGC